MLYLTAGGNTFFDCLLRKAVRLIVVALVADAVKNFINRSGVYGVDRVSAEVGGIFGSDAVTHLIDVKRKHAFEVGSEIFRELVEDVNKALHIRNGTRIDRHIDTLVVCQKVC